jgi:hypothetical protein
MSKIFATLIFSALILGACSTGIASPQAIPPSPTEAPVISPTITLTSTPVVCNFQETTKDLPELSSSFQQSIQALQPEAQARAYAFGENCVGWGRNIVSFSARGTVFSVSLQVDDWANESVLGKRIVQVMEVIEKIPAEQIAGPSPVQVNIAFRSSTDRFIYFSIDQYKELPSGLNYAEIYEAVKTKGTCYLSGLVTGPC